MEDQIYFIETANGDKVKIGITSRSARERLRQLQTASPEPLRLLGAIYGDRNTETTLHSMFDKDRLSGEWFTKSMELSSFIESILSGESSVHSLPSRKIKPSADTKPTKSALKLHPYKSSHKITIGISTGPMSDLLESKIRNNWEDMRKLIAELEPGKTLILECPEGVPFKKFRSSAITSGKRIHVGSWAMGTVREGNRLTLYLYPKD